MKVIIFGRIVQAIIAFMALKVITTFLNPTEMGRLALLMALFSFVALVFLNPVGMFINRRLNSWVDNGLVTFYVVRCFAWYVIGACALTVIVLWFVSWFVDVVPSMSFVWMASLVVCTVISATINSAFISYLNLLRHPNQFVLLTLLTLLLSLASSSFLTYYYNGSAEMWQLGQVFGQLLIGGIGFLAFIGLIKKPYKHDSVIVPKLTSDKMKFFYAFTWPVAVAVLCLWGQTQFYRFLIPEILSLELLGLFTIGYGLGAALLTILESVLSTQFLPEFYKKLSSEEGDIRKTAWQEYAIVMLPCLLVSVVVVALISEELAYLLFSQKFQLASEFVIWGAAIEAIRIATATYGLSAHAHMDTAKLIVPHLIGAIVAPLAVFVLAPHLEGLGIGLGLAIGGVSSLCFCAIIMNRYFSAKTPWSEIVRSMFISLMIFLLFEFIHGYVDSDGDVVVSILWLLVMGGVLLSVLFKFIYPHLVSAKINSINN